MITRAIGEHEVRALVSRMGFDVSPFGQIIGDNVLPARMVAMPATAIGLLSASRKIVGLIPDADWILFHLNSGASCIGIDRFQLERISFGPTAGPESIPSSVVLDGGDMRSRCVLADLIYATLIQSADADVVWSTSMGAEKITLQDGMPYLSVARDPHASGETLLADRSLENWVAEFNYLCQQASVAPTDASN